MSKASGSGSGSALVDLPSECLDQVVQLLDPAECLNSLQTCVAVRNGVLRSSAHTARLRLQLGGAPAPQAPPAGLQLVHHNACRSVHLFLVPDGPIDNYWWSAPLMFHRWTQSLGTPLVAITQVSLKDLKVHLVPEFLTKACPNMSKLSLSGCTIKPSPLPNGRLHLCPQLRELHLDTCKVTQAAAAATAEAGEEEAGPVHLARQQLKSLPGLHTLTINATPLYERLSVITALHEHLTHLELKHLTQAPGPEGFHLPTLAHLVTLHVPQLNVCDHVMEPFLTLGCVTDVRVNAFYLGEDHRGAVCRWKRVGVNELVVISAAHLPLTHVTRLEVLGAISRIQVAESDEGCAYDLDKTNQAVSNISLAGGVHFPHTLWLSLEARRPDEEEGGEVTPQEASALLMATLPLISLYSGHLGLVQVDPMCQQVVHTLGQALCTTLKEITFVCCRWHPEVNSTLLSTLPASIKTLRLAWNSKSSLANLGPTRADVAEICRHAVRPVTVEVAADNEAGREAWADDVREAMVQGGHQHVTYKDMGWDPSSEEEESDSE